MEQFVEEAREIRARPDIKAIVLKVDKFGNLVTNISERDVPAFYSENPPEFKLTVGRAEVTKLKRTFAEGTAGEIFAVIGSMGFIELASNRGNASIAAQAGKGAEIQITFAQPLPETPSTPA